MFSIFFGDSFPRRITMYIKSITIDGFKSYAERTVVNDFDRSFNSITGLNGSGEYQQLFKNSLYAIFPICPIS